MQPPRGFARKKPIACRSTRRLLEQTFPLVEPNRFQIDAAQPSQAANCQGFHVNPTCTLSLNPVPTYGVKHKNSDTAAMRQDHRTDLGWRDFHVSLALNPYLSS